MTVIATATAALVVSFLSGLLFLATFGRSSTIAKKIPIPFTTPTPKYEVMGAIAIPSPTPKVSPSPSPNNKPKMGKFIRPNAIDDELRQKVLSEAGV